MLDQNDLKILAGMFAASEERMMKRIDRLEERMDRLEARIDGLEGRMDRLEKSVDALRIQQKKMEENIYDEIGRVQTYLEKKIDAVQKDVDEMKQYYRIERMENAASTTILRIVSDLQKDVAELKQKIA
ncbi:MAG: hypothetical protein IJA58_01470 [Lachnospiraceae bacterium]|nr:hypothetical protein [Lachnospiraceae bacterium]